MYADTPIGSIQAYGGTSAPTGWFLCQGQAISRTTYAELFAVIGTAFGAGDRSTTFNVPDLRESVPVGSGKNTTATIAVHDTFAIGQFKDDQVKEHTHSMTHNHTASSSMTYVHRVASGGTTMTTSAYPLKDISEKGTVNNMGASYKMTTTVNNYTGNTGKSGSGTTTHGKQLGVNYIIKAKQTPVPTDFTDSLIGYLGKETNYNLYPWSHERTVEAPDDNQDITIERDGWYSIDYTLSSGTDTNHTFTLRDFDSQGDVHTIMRSVYDKSGIFRQTFLVPLKAGTYRYSHGGIGTLSVYMNRRDFA
ncbi:MAG: Phage Tail Collar Domain protein [Bacteroidetes bacterium ADurb.Bin302]|nr:MAG: Phage Tail Collar Domain protein [Bacteroidetes bacterium ADurb.Bin302]